MHTVTYLRMPFTFFKFSSFIWDIYDTSVLWCSCTPSLMEGAPPKPPKYPTKIVSSMFNPVKMTGGASPGPSPNPDSKIREGPTTNGQRLGVRTWLPMMFLKTRLYSENNLFHFLLPLLLRPDCGVAQRPSPTDWCLLEKEEWIVIIPSCSGHKCKLHSPTGGFLAFIANTYSYIMSLADVGCQGCHEPWSNKLMDELASSCLKLGQFFLVWWFTTFLIPLFNSLIGDHSIVHWSGMANLWLPVAGLTGGSSHQKHKESTQSRTLSDWSRMD